ncbi:hypothetical protein HSBAA_05080 [Vreelandella sulfidaeris]|uniref:Uncharacterized protein n=1 Tax=Vreelandella sulfidaeris TaxID=115553 RepID=A0A455U036_9GAMM|nr:hypothetical protein HSBAA_05080 [Halomonas sulfidaeris]
MAKEPQTPMDDELARHEHEAEGAEQAAEKVAEERLMEGELEGLINDEEPLEGNVDNPEAEMLAAQVGELEQSLADARIKPCAPPRKHKTCVAVPSRKLRKRASSRLRSL